MSASWRVQAPSLQIVLDRQRREHLPAFRHLHDAARTRSMRRHAVDRLARRNGSSRPRSAARRRSRAATWSCRRRCCRPARRSRLPPPRATRRAAPRCGRSGCEGCQCQHAPPPRCMRAEIGRDHGRIGAHLRAPCLRPACGPGRAHGCGWRSSSPAACRARPARTVTPCAGDLLDHGVDLRGLDRDCSRRPARRAAAPSARSRAHARSRAASARHRAIRPAGRSANARRPTNASSSSALRARLAVLPHHATAARTDARSTIAALVQVAADHHVLDRGHAEENLQVLERARQPALREQMRRRAR